MNITVLIIVAIITIILIIVLSLFGKKEDGQIENKKASKFKNEYKIEASYYSGISKNKLNLIILSVFFVILLISEFFVIRMVKHKENILKIQKNKYSQKLKSISSKIVAYDEIKKEYNKIKEESSFNNKIIPKTDSPTLSLNYFFNLTDKYSNYMHFNFALSDSGVVKIDKSVKYNKYVLTGKSYLNQIYNFLDQLERQPKFYTIESMALNALDADKRGKIEFSLEIMAYYSQANNNKIPLVAKLHKKHLNFNPFYPRIHSPILPKDSLFISLLDVNMGQLVALTDAQAFIKDLQTGLISAFKVGDKVKYGELDFIDWKQQRVVFKINRYGLTEKQYMYIEKTEGINLEEEKL